MTLPARHGLLSRPRAVLASPIQRGRSDDLMVSRARAVEVGIAGQVLADEALTAVERVTQAVWMGNRMRAVDELHRLGKRATAARTEFSTWTSCCERAR